MTSTRRTQAGTEPRSRRVFGIPIRELRLSTRVLTLRILGATPWPALWTRFCGTGDIILCLHNVVERHGVLGVNRGLDITAGELEELINYLQRERYRPTTLEDIVLDNPASFKGEKRVAITFDDGYAGNLHVAYPILLRHNIPFTVYVTTGFMDREVRVWWYALERLLTVLDRVSFEHGAQVYSYDTETLAQKVHAYRSIRALLSEACALASDHLLEQLFAGRVKNLRDLPNDDLLTPEQVLTLSRDSLVTIGAHSVSHPVLHTLTDEESRHEIDACRQRLETVTGTPVRHFAYPFGNRRAFGPREERFVQESGYMTATTTSARKVARIDRLTALPRIMLSAEFDAVTSLGVLRTGWFGHRN